MRSLLSYNNMSAVPVLVGFSSIERDDYYEFSVRVIHLLEVSKMLQVSIIINFQSIAISSHIS